MKFPTAYIPAALLAGLLVSFSAGDTQGQILIFGGGGFGGSTTSTATSSTTFQGQAAAVSGVVGGGYVSVANSGALAAYGGAQEAAALETAVGTGVAVGACHSAVVAGGIVSSAEASVANISFTAASFFGAATTITADFIMAQASTICGAFGATVSGHVQISGLVINGQAIAVTGAANQFVWLASGGYVIINEQSGGFGSLTVNAVHIIDAFANVNVIFASSLAGINCGSQPSPSTPPTTVAPCDFVTGGGWITGTPSGAKGNFGVAGGIKNGAFWGHLNYIDHGNGMHVKATAVTGYAFDPSDPDCRIIDYAVTVNGQPGTARVRVCDKGEPGRNDIFQIQLSTGYSAGGDLGGSHPGGGNIQLHRCH